MTNARTQVKTIEELAIGEKCSIEESGEFFHLGPYRGSSEGTQIYHSLARRQGDGSSIIEFIVRPKTPVEKGIVIFGDGERSAAGPSLCAEGSQAYDWLNPRLEKVGK